MEFYRNNIIVWLYDRSLVSIDPNVGVKEIGYPIADRLRALDHGTSFFKRTPTNEILVGDKNHEYSLSLADERCNWKENIKFPSLVAA